MERSQSVTPVIRSMLNFANAMIFKPYRYAIWIAILFSTSAGAGQPVRLRVLSYNIHHGEGVDGKLDLERIAGVIQSVNPDLVALQEVDDKAKRTGGIAQPTELARLTQMHVVFGANIELQGGHYGNAVLSRFPISRHENHQLPNLDNGEQRGVIETQIHVSSAIQPILLFATHLDHRRDGRERSQSANAINQLIEQRLDAPALLAGDLNDVVDSETLTRLETKWTCTNATPLPTIPVGKPSRQIDFILYRPIDRWSVIETRVLDESVASDHRAVLAVLELLPQSNE
ncbi:MAG: endonuclease/exonuclease/phosphatase family protein [Planctomycetales bacterium]|nr:endonuclease/exonuclease/phosphatase family protein [Planctomycetales bacterium]